MEYLFIYENDVQMLLSVDEVAWVITTVRVIWKEPELNI